jgi:hypothetical protein
VKWPCRWRCRCGSLEVVSLFDAYGEVEDPGPKTFRPAPTSPESPQSKILVDSTLRERGRGAILPCPTLLACSTLRLFFACSHPCRSWTICSTTLRQQTPITTCKTAPVPPSHHQSSHQLSQSRSVVHNTNPTTRTSTSTRQHEQRAIL